MKPLFVLHETYQDFVLKLLQMHYSGDVFSIVKKDWPLVAKFWRTDFSYITTLLQDEYAAKGPEPRDPASMFRSYLISIAVAHPLNAPINEKRLTTSWNLGDIAPLKCGTFEFMAL